MLEEIYIKNIALIDDIKIEFTSGFNVLTGESGSGKSLIAGAIGLLKGVKGDTGVIRTGEDSAEAAGVFGLKNNQDVLDWLSVKGISAEDDSIIIRRSVKANGRGTITVQSTPLSRSELIELTSLLFDIHGQNEHHTIMSEERQRNLLDSYSGLLGDAADFSSLFSELGKMKKRLTGLELSEKERLREIDILKFTVNEISEAKISAAEDEEIEKEHKMLVEHEKLFRYVAESREELSESTAGIIPRLKNALNASSAAAAIDESLLPLSERLSNAFFEIEDIAELLRDYVLKDNFSPARLAKCEERLAVIHRLKKKYGPEIDDVINHQNVSENRLAELENLAIDREELKARIKKMEDEVLKKASALSDERKKNSAVLEKKIEDILKQLGMPEVVFSIQVKSRKNDSGKPVCGSYGFDQVEFLISPNTGEPLKPIDQIASGGEMSRIMLAVKSVFSDSDPVDSMLFDEIDSGIGGEVAVSLGYHLQKLSKIKQIICITHLASIAVNADNHIRVNKIIENKRTVTRAEKVDNDSRVTEIARMLSGDQSANASLEHARVLLSKRGLNG
ncbi:MAG: DNA repair protein RecN [Spirochaetales bacterium]|nr:DNA repair protein RecN [Spirochaetales bacterium]